MSVTFESCLSRARQRTGPMRRALVRTCWVLFCTVTGPIHSQEVKPTFIGATMSLNFQNIEVRTALQIVADFTGLNIITSDSVTGSLTLKLHKVPWDQVLDIMAQAKGLSVRRQGNVIWVAPRAEVAAREKLEYESKLAAQNLEPVSYTHLTLPTNREV